tara:strand:- start:1234 stop:1644 length:411 start_codon:yes stop_codon:yes gene_type:complete
MADSRDTGTLLVFQDEKYSESIKKLKNGIASFYSNHENISKDFKNKFENAVEEQQLNEIKSLSMSVDEINKMTERAADSHSDSIDELSKELLEKTSKNIKENISDSVFSLKNSLNYNSLKGGEIKKIKKIFIKYSI